MVNENMCISEYIFENAIDSIELGIEDFQAIKNDRRRSISAVRNIFAGILLLFKSKLAELSVEDDEALLKEDIMPKIINGQIKWIGKGKKTVDFQEIQKRFESLGVTVDWSLLKDIQNYRNNIEHYYDHNHTNIKVVSQYITKSFIVICDFIKKHCNKIPQDCFSQEIWETFIAEQKVYESELEDAHKYLESLDWYDNKILNIFKGLLCPECFSFLLAPTQKNLKACDSVFRCRNCSSEWSYDKLIKLIAKSMDAKLGYDGDDPVGYCPHCDEKTYITELKLCLSCGERGPYECERCGDIVPTSELITYGETGLCGYCSHMSEDLDDD